MNSRLVDWWTVTHIISTFILSSVLLSTGAEILSVLIAVIFVALIYEILEHMILFNLVEKAKEVSGNSILDIVFGLLGMVIAIILM